MFVIKLKRNQLGMKMRLVDFSMRLMMRVSQIINPSSKINISDSNRFLNLTFILISLKIIHFTR